MKNLWKYDFRASKRVNSYLSNNALDHGGGGGAQSLLVLVFSISVDVVTISSSSIVGKGVILPFF